MKEESILCPLGPLRKHLIKKCRELNGEIVQNAVKARRREGSDLFVAAEKSVDRNF